MPIIKTYYNCSYCEAKRFSQRNRELGKRECIPLPEIKIRKSSFLCKIHFLVPLCKLRKPFLSAQGLGAPVAGIKSYPSIDVAPKNSHANPLRFFVPKSASRINKGCCLKNKRMGTRKSVCKVEVLLNWTLSTIQIMEMMFSEIVSGRILSWT
ncbi:hypothetical protein TNIN_260671 [Trichonephila inaurata madagascariensis]|uniref:Uncharacterized protein n=1 Tax=Trichonephila inaurata madagascariensis TaxID=2747483 RepID=A0A8X6YTR6_9ARAC|nr:hypothetical protein TNIN_260671 [Trichonephila inaurata madagascariensis]